MLSDALAVSNTVKGWLTSNEQALLYTLAQSVLPDNAIVELGAWMGKSTIMLAAGSFAGSRVPVYAVDFFGPSQDAGLDYSRHLAPGTQEYLSMLLTHVRQACLDSLVIPIRSSTVDAAEIYTGPNVHLLFIDANHSYHAVCNDFLAWVAHCSPGAQIAFHDYTNTRFPGVSRFVDRLLVTRILARTRVVDSILSGDLTVSDLTIIQRRLSFCPDWLPRVMKFARRILRRILHQRAALRVFQRSKEGLLLVLGRK